MNDSTTDRTITDANDRSPLAYVVILNYNNLRDTVETIDSVLATEYDNFRVLLVENSTDHTVVDQSGCSSLISSSWRPDATWDTQAGITLASSIR